MRIIIDIDDEVWSEAWSNWDEGLPEGKRYLDTGKSNWAKHTKLVRDRVVAAVGMPIEKIRMIEEPTDDEYFGEGEEDER